MNIAQYITTTLAKEGIETIFFVPGGAAMHLNDALATTKNLSYVSTFHEHAASIAAESYAKTKGDLGVAMVTAGPGSTNAISGVASAWVNSAPVLVLSGQVKLADLNNSGLRQNGLQEIDIISIVTPITKYAVTITDPLTIRFHLEKAIFLARTGRPGPVWLCLPLDLQAIQIDTESQVGFTNHIPEAPSFDDEIESIIDILNKSERPVILAGGGIRTSGAEQQFLELVEMLGIPVLTTWVAADIIPADHALYAGRPGSFASRGANFTIQNADFLLSLGARLDLATTGYSRKMFAKSATRVIIDVDKSEIEKLQDQEDLKITASADIFIDALMKKKSKIAPIRRTTWLNRIKNWKNTYPVTTQDYRNKSDCTSTYVLIEKLGDLLNNDDIIVEGSAGIHSEIFFMVFSNKVRQRIIADGSYGSMGYGIPAAIGACIAGRRRKTILIEGDGSLQPNIQELETIKREKLPIKIVVVNNSGYSSIRVSQSRYFSRLVGADSTSGLTLPSLAKIAAAYGIRCVRIESENELEEKLREALDGDDPVLCEVIVPSEEDRLPRLASYQREDGTMMSKPLEDMYPFLSDTELAENMLNDPIRKE